MKLSRRSFFGVGLAVGAIAASAGKAASEPPQPTAPAVAVDEIRGLNFRGPYSPLDNYVVGDVVHYHGGVYLCANGWQVLAAPGHP